MANKAVEPKSDKIDGIDKWEVESAAETLQHAQEIMANDKLRKAALKVLKKKQVAAKKAVSWADNL